MVSLPLVFPSVSLNHHACFDACDSSILRKSSVWFRGLKHGLQRRNVNKKSRVSMSVSVGSNTAIDDALFVNYKPTTAFMFPGQVKFVN